MRRTAGPENTETKGKRRPTKIRLFMKLSYKVGGVCLDLGSFFRLRRAFSACRAEAPGGPQWLPMGEIGQRRVGLGKRWT